MIKFLCDLLKLIIFLFIDCIVLIIPFRVEYVPLILYGGSSNKFKIKFILLLELIAFLTVK